MRQLSFLLYLCACSITMAQIPESNPIQEAMANYNYETAIRLIDDQPPTLPLLIQKAKALKGLNLSSEALTTFEQILVEQPENQQVIIEAAECCRQIGKNNDVLVYYQKVTALNPNNKYARMQYIRLLCNLGKYKEAHCESTSIATTDSSAAVLRLIAESLEGMNQTLECMQCYVSITNKYPSDYLSHAKLASLFITLEDYQSAKIITEEYRKRDTTNLDVNRQNALAHCLLKDYPTSIKRYEYLTSQGDSTFTTCYYLGASYYAVEKYYEAHYWLEKASTLSNPSANLFYYLGRSCSKTSWKKEGIEYLEQAIDLTIPKDSVMERLYHGLADCYGLAQKMPEKIRTLKEQYKYAPTKHILLFRMALAADKLKDNKATEYYLEAFLKTKPQNSTPTPPSDMDEETNPNVDYYSNAARKLKLLRQERFFKEGIPKQQQKSNQTKSPKEE